MQRDARSKNDLAHRVYTVGEEIANSISHGVGAGLSVAGLTVLVVLAAIYGDVWHVVSFSIYGSTLVILYLASTLYHSLRSPGAKRVFRIIDHSTIYLLIAGTYTPFLLVSLRGPLGWTLLVVVWVLALTGVGFKTLFIARFRRLSIAAYLLMGWASLVAVKPMLANIPRGGVYLLAVGGLLYTAGLVFYLWKRLPYGHLVWHLFVLGGSAAHFFAILLYLLPMG